MSVLYWIHVKCFVHWAYECLWCCLSCSSWAFSSDISISFTSHAIKWSRSVGRDTVQIGGQNKQSKANMAGPFKCGSQVHAQTHTRKPQTHFCQRGERPSYRRLQRDRNDGIKDGGAQPSAARRPLWKRLCLTLLSVSLDPSQLFSVVSNER